MPIVDMGDMLSHARHNSYAVGGFEVLSLDFLEAIIRAAETCRAPVILNVVEFHFEHYDFECVIAAAEKAARRATVPVALHLDHCHTFEMAVRAINLGCNSLMLDAGHELFSSNVAQTRKVVEMAHACGMCVEGELGYDTGLVTVDTEFQTGENSYTSVEEAKAFVARTEVDCLAVSIGTTHGHKPGRTKLDIERLKRIHEAVEVPLVIHGGSGLSDEQYRKLISHGVARINYSTALADIAADHIRTNLRNNARAGYTGLVSGMREALQIEVERCMRMWGAAGRAAEVLVQCHTLTPIEHVIVYNVEGAADSEVEAIMAHGRETLSRIPGVRRVFTGWAVNQNSRYRCCWLVEFAHAKVIDTYRDHPDHAAFANQLFRPIAGDRITIDFAEVSSQTDTKVVQGKFRARA